MPVAGASDKVALASQRVGDWRSHIFHWPGIIGTVATLLFGVLSVYFYHASKIKPLLTFAVHPLKTELRRPDYDKELGFVYKGKALDSESVTSVQVGIWNAGTRSIRDSDVLDPFRLVIPDGSAILSVQARKIARPVCGFEILGNQEDYKSGICRLKWRILEPGDGAVLQIIYAGSARRNPTLEGAVEGQRGGIVIERYNLNPRGTAIEELIPRWGFALLPICLFLLLIAGRLQRKTDAGKKWAEERAAAAKHLAEVAKKPVPASPFVWALCVGAIVCLLGFFATLLIFSSRPGPPFGW